MEKNQGEIAVYSRKSKFTGKGESIGNQIELCRNYIRSMFGEEALAQIAVFEDEGFSGGDLKRPAFQNMMECVRKHRFRAIVVYRLDRISRNISDFTNLIDELTRLGVSFVSIREQFDTSTPMGRAMMFIISVFSQLERETIAERIRDNMHELAKTGRWLGGNTPTGFASESVTTVTVDGRARKACRLMPIPEEAALVRKLFDFYLETDSLTATEAKALSWGLKTKTGRDFSRFAIKAILQNPVYLTADAAAYQYFAAKNVEVFGDSHDFDGTRGILAYNRTAQEKGHAAKLLPMEDWIVAVGAHPGLIPSEKWLRVQASLERNKSKAYRKSRTNQALLAGLLWCRCGERMYPKLSRRALEDGTQVFSYVCKGKERSKGTLCCCRNINGNALDTLLVQKISALPVEERQLKESLQKGILSAGAAFPGDSREQLREACRTNEKKIGKLIDTLSLLETPEARQRIAKRIEELNEETAEKQARLQKMETEHPAELSLEEKTRLRKELASFSGVWVGMALEEKRAAVRMLISKVLWDGSRAEIYFNANEIEKSRKKMYHLCEDSK